MNTQVFPAVGCMQFQIRLGDPAQNIAQVAFQLDHLRPKADTLLVLPEMWATGFDYQQIVEFGRETPEILAQLHRLAKRYHVYLAGSLTELTGGDGLPFNVMYLVGPEGIVGRLPKQHLFAYWQEDRYYQPGYHPPLRTPHGLLAGAICYDLRFPESIRRQVHAGSGLLAVSAQWPFSRLDHWRTLVRARAIENQCYVAAANSCGMTGKMELAGHSMIIAPDGTVLQECGVDEAVVCCPLDASWVAELRGKFYPAGQRPWLQSDCAKIRHLGELCSELAATRQYQSRVAFTNGCFDLLHAGHVSYLERARQTADCLVVGLNSDRSVKALKGEGRPVNSQEDRARVLAALGCVDFVVIFDELTPLRLITEIKPDVLVKGADWEEAQIVGAQEVREAGGEVVRIAFEHDRSTTALIKTILDQETRS